MNNSSNNYSNVSPNMFTYQQVLNKNLDNHRENYFKMNSKIDDQINKQLNKIQKKKEKKKDTERKISQKSENQKNQKNVNENKNDPVHENPVHKNDSYPVYKADSLENYEHISPKGFLQPQLFNSLNTIDNDKLLPVNNPIFNINQGLPVQQFVSQPFSQSFVSQPFIQQPFVQQPFSQPFVSQPFSQPFVSQPFQQPFVQQPFVQQPFSQPFSPSFQQQQPLIKEFVFDSSLRTPIDSSLRIPIENSLRPFNDISSFSSNFRSELEIESEDEDEDERKSYKRCYTCKPRGKVKKHIIGKSICGNFIFHHDLNNRPMIILTPIEHIVNIIDFKNEHLKMMFEAIEVFCGFWNIKEYQVMYNSGDWKKNEHFHIKIKISEEVSTKMKNDHFLRIKKESELMKN